MYTLLRKYDLDFGEHWRCDGGKKVLECIGLGVLGDYCRFRDFYGSKGGVARQVEAFGGHWRSNVS